MVYEPGRAGQVSEETQFVLDYFGVEAPRFIEHVKTQVRDIDVRETKGVKKNISLKKGMEFDASFQCCDTSSSD